MRDCSFRASASSCCSSGRSCILFRFGIDHPLFSRRMPASRRISNRESARRLRKQRSDKLHNLMSQQDSLAGLTDGLKSQIAAQRTKLKVLMSLNQDMQSRLFTHVCFLLHCVSNTHALPLQCNVVKLIMSCLTACVSLQCPPDWKPHAVFLICVHRCCNASVQNIACL